MTPPRRDEILDRLRADPIWDVVAIGGGASGLGSAVDAASRGYATLLVEARDFAQGTSSRSTKLIHGGVRYLARGEVGLVREALRERALLRSNAPGLVHERSFLVPAYSLWRKAEYGIGLKLYDLLGRGGGFPRSRLVSRDEAIASAPTIEPRHLRGGVIYADGQFDDARLAVALLRTLLDRGGAALNYAPVVGFEHANGRLAALRLRDDETGEELRVRARVFLNAAGAQVDDLRAYDDPRATPVVRPSRGAHIVLDRAFLPGETAIMIPKTDDGRVLFAIPWLGRVVVGTTDTPSADAPSEPHADESEIAFLLDHAGRYLTRDPAREDILSVFAGLRPLIDRGASRATAALSREHAVLVSPSGLVTLVGGKWTTYRRMAEDAVDRAAEVGGLARSPCATAGLRLVGADDDERSAFVATRPAWSVPLHPALPDREGDVVWAARREMAVRVEDVLARRTRLLFLDARASLDAAPRVAALLASELGRDAAWADSQVRAFRTLAEGYLPPRYGV